MRKLTLLFLVVPFALVNADVPPAAKDGDKLPVQEVRIETGNGWWFRCAADGSGSLGYGSLSIDSTGFKAETFEFKALVQELERVTTKEEPKGIRCGVMLRKKGVQPINLYTNDTKMIQALFAKAAKKEASSVRGDNFDQRWKASPPDLGK